MRSFFHDSNRPSHLSVRRRLDPRRCRAAWGQVGATWACQASKHPKQDVRRQARRGTRTVGEEWHRQWGRDRSSSVQERRSNSQERVTGWSSRGKAERNKEERERHAETQRVGKQKRQREPKKRSLLETLQLGCHQPLSSTHCVTRRASSHAGQSLTVRRAHFLDLAKKSLRVMRRLNTERWAHRTVMTSKQGITTLYFTGPWK